MPSLIYTSFFEDLAKANIDFDTAVIKVMLVTSTYTENKDTHVSKTDITNEITGTGYTAGGNTATCTVTKDTTNDRLDISLGGTTWTTSTITARKAVYYVSSTNQLIAVNDFGSDVITSGTTFTLNASTLRIQN